MTIGDGSEVFDGFNFEMFHFKIILKWLFSKSTHSCLILFKLRLRGVCCSLGHDALKTYLFMAV